jgi:tetratricopeptide (TPR) repeat protein
MWPFSPVGKQKSCEYLAQLGDEARAKQADEHGSLYAPWIAYLSLETSSSPACDLETAFRIATDSIAKHKLCGRGYAFLSAYYSYKRVLDRSRSFLEEALQASPKDPWVKLVEGVVHERDLRDNEEAVHILNGLLRTEPYFALAQYHLAKIYLKEEEYGKSKDLFSRLEKAFPQQQGFTRIRESLAGIEHVPYYSVQRAKGLLKVSRALSGMMDYPLAGQLCRTVLEDMPGTLPRAEKKSAFYDLGRISEITGDKETAFACYQNALRIDPFFRDARERIGSIMKGDAQTS